MSLRQLASRNRDLYPGPASGPGRCQAKAAVVVARDLVDELDFPGEVFAHKALALGGPVARRERYVVGLVGGLGHAGFERQTGGCPGRGPAGQHLDRAPRADLGRGIAGGDTVLAGQDQIARRRQFVERLAEPGADRKPGAGDVPLAMTPAERQVDDHGGAVRLQLLRRDRGGFGTVEREHARIGRRHARFQRRTVKTMVKHHRIPAHALEPRGGHPRPDPGVVDQDDARTPHAEPAVGLLDQLPARRRQRARQMPVAVLGRVAHIEHVKRAPVGLALPLRQSRAVDCRHAVAPRDRVGALPRRGDARGRDFGCAPRRPADHVKPGEMPRHRAVLQRHDPVRHAGVDQCLGADDAARAPAAIDDDERVGRRHHFVKAVDQLGTGDADGTGDAVRVVFRVGTAVENHQVFAAAVGAAPVPRR